MNSEHYLTLDQAAERAQVSRHTLMRWIRTAGCPCIIFSERLKRVPVAEFDAWMREYLKISGSLKTSPVVRAMDHFLETIKATK